MRGLLKKKGQPKELRWERGITGRVVIGTPDKQPRRRWHGKRKPPGGKSLTGGMETKGGKFRRHSVFYKPFSIY